MKNKKINLCLILFFSIIFGFILYFSVPSKIVLPVGSNLGIKTLPFYSVKTASDNPTVQCSNGQINVNFSQTGEFEYNVNVFESIPFKKLKVSVVPKTYVIPSGEAVGVKMFTDGLLVVYVSDVIDESGNRHSPAKEAGLRETDRILSVDNLEIGTNEEFSDYINTARTTVHLKVARDEEVFETDITPVLSNDGSYRIGIWVRDSTAGIGTLTFYNPQDKSFAALGHAITDCDTKTILTVSDGDLVGCEILSVKKGEHGEPGELSGQFKNKVIGKILKNNDYGLYGTLENVDTLQSKTIEAATRFQIKQGSAEILCDVDGKGVKSYDVEITSVSKEEKTYNKGIVLKVTDEELLSKTGGIVQGMSGSPIIQNGMLVGAVTHVFVNDPTRGYGIFIENMLTQTKQD